MKSKKLMFYDLYTEAGEALDGTDKVWEQYPRPQLVRENWQCLNGIWDLDEESIRVPFSPESLLSEYKGEVKDCMIYTKRFSVHEFDEKKRTLLHFQAVDQEAEVYLNGEYLGAHVGGYLPFCFDITELVKEKNNLLQVKVRDELNQDYPYGKQCKKRGGMWYTPISGIWQSVWLEQVPLTYIKKINILPDRKGIYLQVSSEGEVIDKVAFSIKLHNGEEYSSELVGCEGYIDLSKVILKNGEYYVPQLWNTEVPYLYTMTLTAVNDNVETYFALRTIELRRLNQKDVMPVVCLNGEPIYLHGVLDQGYYSDGIMTPAEEMEFERDVLRMKELGFNLLRKHIKIEPECFYYFCDKHGMLVMQDMVNNGEYSFWRDTALPTIGLQLRDDKHIVGEENRKSIFEKHMQDTISHLYNHPCVIAYTIFNEGWGQVESDRMYTLARTQDSSRLYDATSGWFAQKESDFHSVHIYFGSRKPKGKERPILLSEFGGYSYLIQEHIYSNKSYGYGTCKSSEELIERIEKRYQELVFPFLDKGLCGSIYTQLSDVEDEINGFYTYDRKICKVDLQRMKNLANLIYTKFHKIIQERLEES